MSFGYALVFGVLLVPLYVVLLGWFLGKPRELKPAGIGVGFMVVFLAALVAGSLVTIHFGWVMP